jgi:flagellar motor switch protein FliG
MAENALAKRDARPPALPGGVEKAAILLLTLGPDAAASVFRHLSEDEVRQVTAAIARLRSIPREQAAAVQEEAWRRLSEQEGLLVDGERFARQLIASGLATGHGHEAARELERATQSGGDFLASTVQGLPPAVVAQVLGSEHPQVIAVVLASLAPKQAAAVLGALPETIQPDIVQRIADLQEVSEDLLAEVGEVLQVLVRGLERPPAAAGVRPAGAKIAADIMNAVDDTVEEQVFAQLDEQAPEVAETIRNLMLTFEDLVRLDNRGMQTVLKEVAREDLMLALKTASPAMRDKVFGNISQRAREILEEDMSTMGPVRIKDVEKAQTNIVTVVRRLEAEQKITLGGGGDDVIV